MSYNAADLTPEQLKALFDAHELWPGAWVTVRDGVQPPWRGLVIEPLDPSGKMWFVAHKHPTGKGFMGGMRIARGFIEKPNLLERIAWEVADAEKDDATQKP